MIGNSKENTYVLIMAGGVGSRFWPKSRNHFPKQFLDILGIGKSLLQLTYDRFLNICPAENIYILSNDLYKEVIIDQLSELNNDQILLEPSRNNTAPCIAYACYRILQSNPEANIVVAPSDHLILKENEFIDRINQALNFTKKNDALLTLGITPTRPDTGYGYVNFNSEGHAGIYKVERFVEKPILEKAIEFIERGDYLWNAGIFIWSAKSIKKAFKKYCPDIDFIFEKGLSFYNTKDEVVFLMENYHKSPNISIDYAILEKADNVYTISADIGWSDLGTWASLHTVADKDGNQNVLNCTEFNLNLTENCIINVPKGKGVVVKGLKDYIIVDDENVLMIYPKSDEQEIKKVAGKMVNDYGDHYM